MRLTSKTPHGTLVLEVQDERLADPCAELFLSARSAERSFGRFVDFAGARAYLKGGPLRGKARARHAVARWLLRKTPARLNEYSNLNWLRHHGFNAPLPLAACSLRKSGLPVLDLLLTSEVAGASLLEQKLATCAESDREKICGELARCIGAMHALGFIHRDLFARNLLVAEGDDPAIYLLDAWRGGPRRGLRGTTYDLACLMLDGAALLSPQEQRMLLERYRFERALHAPLPRLEPWLARIARERAKLVRRMRRQGRPTGGFPATWSPPF